MTKCKYICASVMVSECKESSCNNKIDNVIDVTSYNNYNYNYNYNKL